MKLFSLNKAQYTIFVLVLTILLAAGPFFSLPATVSLLLLFLHTSLFGYLVGKIFFEKESTGWQIFFGTIGYGAGITVVLSLFYWFFFFSSGALAVTIAIVSILLLLAASKKIKTIQFSSPKLCLSWLHIPLIAAYAALFIKLFSRRLGDTLISPWTLFGPKFFLLFFLTTALLFFLSKKTKYIKENLFFIVLHYFLVLGVVLIVLKHGFGFDPFIHQAAEGVIDKTGAITPKQPYYIGQYMLALSLHAVTGVRIALLDTLLVPLLSSISIPLFAYRSLKEKVKGEYLLPAIIFLTFIPLSFFTFTTPNNLALLVALWVIFWIVYEQQHATMRTHIFGALLSILACSIHPFVGIPILLVYAGSLVLRKWDSLFSRVGYVIALIFGLPAVLWLNGIRLGEQMMLHNPLARLHPFIRLFQKPHWFSFENAPFGWQVLYGYRLALIPLALAISVVGLYYLLKRKQRDYFFLISVIGLFLSAFFLSTSIEFRNVISYEQGVYGQRVLQLCFVLLFPFFLFGTVHLMQYKRCSKKFLFPFFVAGLLLVSWYFTYPTRDPISLHTGYAVRDADIEAVHFIHQRNENKNDYIVLTNQIVSAAAIKELGFFSYHDTVQGEQYAYAIPTGGPFYQYFRKMVYEEPKREWMEQAMTFAGVSRAYFVHTDYWAPAATIRDEAKKEADDWWELGDGRVWVYEYIK